MALYNCLGLIAPGLK